LLFAETPKSKIHSPAVGGFPQSDVLFYNCLLWVFAAAVSAAEWFFIAAYQSRPVWRGLSAAMKKDILLRVLCASSEAPQRRDFRNAPTRGDVLLTHLPA
jgi:hypothetical protein